MDYKEVNDYELVSLVREQHEEAKSLLIEKYNNLIKLFVEEHRKTALELGLDESDLYQEGLIGLNYAIESFDENKEASFFTYASICIKTKIKSLLRKYSGKKHKILNGSVSLDNVNKTDKNSYYDIVGEEIYDLSETLLKSEEKEDLIEKINKYLTDFEKTVLNFKLNSYTNEEISKKLKKDKRSIENALYRIRAKYRKLKRKQKNE